MYGLLVSHSSNITVDLTVASRSPLSKRQMTASIYRHDIIIDLANHSRNTMSRRSIFKILSVSKAQFHALHTRLNFPFR
jgi:hypothetical protein